MIVSAIIPTLNRAEDLKLALDSILRQTHPPREVIVVDQSPDQNTLRLAAQMRRVFLEREIDLRYVHQNEKSLVKARNRGLALAEGDILSFLDDDIVLEEDYYHNVARYFELDPRLGGLSGNASIPHPPSGMKWTLRKILMRIFLLSNFDGRMTPSGFGFPIFERGIQRPLQVEMLPGCNMNFRRAALAGDRFDEWFSGYGYREDAEFSYRVSRNAKLIMIPEARLLHRYSENNRLDVERLKKMEVRNYYYMFKKFKGGRLLPRVLFAYSLCGLILIDFIELLTNRTQNKFQKLRGTVLSSLGIWFRGYGR